MQDWQSCDVMESFQLARGAGETGHSAFTHFFHQIIQRMSYYYSTTTSVFATNHKCGKRPDHNNYSYWNIDKSSTSMIFPVTSDPEVLLMMDDTDYREHWLLTEFEDKPEQDMSKSAHDDSYSTALSDTTSSLMDEDDVREAASKIQPRSHQITPNKSSSTPAETPEANSTPAETHGPSSSIGVPNKFDILCGQSRICATHTGNCRFQVVLDIYAPKYENISSKQEKMALTKEIVGCIHMAGGKFLKYKDGVWEEIPDVMARDKCSHALRTKVASWRRQQEQANEEAKQNKPSEKVTPVKKSRHSRYSKRRRSSTSIIASSFDASDTTKSSVMDDLLKAQREIFASLTQSEHGTSSTNEQHPLKR
jgi:hypothetical protein